MNHFSMFANNMPPTAVLACCTSCKSSEATARCLSKGCAKGDSKTGSMGSRGLIKCTKMHILGSETSKTLKGLAGFVLFPSTGEGGMPAGRKRSTLCTGIIKQSRSRVANDMGSDLEQLTVRPLLVPPAAAPPPPPVAKLAEIDYQSGANKWVNKT
ncbi:hypothetical protein FF38_07370 [Lucilia cuprina]|uniref:Uncharacterized protein n=1 Tax=Lucilia cuprina TaxID=7375 RepID=A0A0L0C9K6_LUCCU|nr:hypothetical protein FF38_07370 [Lucilia cuprina]